MPKLHCAAENCAYNEEKHCCLAQIIVEGVEASVPSATACDNFIEKGSITNVGQQMNENLNIICRACACMHNQSGECQAGEIFIVGQDAESTDDTSCCTFCKC